MRYLLTVLMILVALLPAKAALADFQAGFNAYVQGDYATALRELRPLAEQGHPSAQFSLGLMYFTGEGVPPDLDRGMKWWRKADEQGNDQARTSLAILHAQIQKMLSELGFDPGRRDGIVDRKTRDAIIDFQNSRELGVTGKISGELFAHVVLAAAEAALAGLQAGQTAYNQGDYATALRELRPLAEQGHPTAQFTLGFMYFSGQGVPQDLDLAIRWLRKADEQGSDQARKLLVALHSDIQKGLAELGFDPGRRDGIVDRKTRNAIIAFQNSRRLGVTGKISGELFAHVVPTAVIKEGGPPTEPMLRLETGMHTAIIKSIDVDAAGQMLATASDDKTVRLWSLPDGRLFRVLRVPVGADNEGKLYAVAVSPDGTRIAASGWTGWDWDKTTSVYLFDVATGRLTQRLSILSNGIAHLTFSRDGRFLAATLGAGGVRVWRTGDWRPVLADTDYGKESVWADFSPDGRLVTTSVDGFVRLYSRSFRQIAKVRAPGGKHPLSAVFSPDGHRIAVGFSDSERVSVLSGTDLRFLFTPDTAGVNDGNLGSVAWSADGQFLYAGGRWISLAGRTHIRRWADGGRGRHSDFAASNNTIMDIRPLPGGGVVFSAGGVAFGAFDASGRKVLDRTPAITDMRGVDQGGFLISRDGSRVQFGFENGDERPAVFSIGERKLTFDPPRDPALAASVTSAPGLSVTGRFNTREPPKLNGRPLKLRKGEISNCLAIAPSGDAFVLGTEWFLRLFGRDGRQKWGVLVDGMTWGVNVAGSGRVVVAAFGDGTIRWYRMRDGVEILAFFPHRNGSDWVAWTPDGYYMSSPGGDDLIGWHINNGKDTVPDFYSARQFERILHRPDYVLAYFKHLGDREKAMAEVGGDFFDINKLASIAPPKIEIVVPANGASVSGDRVKLRFEVEKRSLPMRDYSVFVNGIPVTPAAERALGGTERGAFAREVEIPLFGADNDIRIEAFNGTSMGVTETFVRRSGGTPSAVKGNLYLLAVGANRFPGLAGADLDYAALDAEAMAAFFKGREGGAFGRVFTKTVSDNATLKPTRQIILQMLDFVKRATAQDTVIVFLASHGLSDSRGTYYFVPQDAASGDVETVLASAKGGRALTEGGTDAPTLISWESFFEALRSTAGRRLLVVDTCQAKNIAGTLDVHSLAKRSASASFALMAASQGTEGSQEYPPGKHGLFTYAILQGLSGKGDGDGDGRITLDELFKFTVGFVSTNRPHAHLPQTPQLTAPGMLGEMVLARRQETAIGPLAPLAAPSHKVTADPARFFRVQLVSTRSWDGLQAEWNRLQRNNLDLLGELKPSVDKVDLGRRTGVFYRLRAGPVADEQMARSLCAALKKRRIGCFIVPPKG
jgi:TPR repeat protein